MKVEPSVCRAKRAARTRRIGAAIVVGLAITSGFPVHSAADQPAAGANDAIALKRFEDGKNHYDAGEFELSLIDFRASNAMLPSPNSRLYIARCLRALNKFGSAYVSYRLAMREATDRLNTTGEKRYKATRDAASSEMAEIEDKVPRLTVAVPSDVPSDFVVLVDGVPLPKEAWGSAIETDPGKHEVTATGLRRKPFAQSFELPEGVQKSISVVSDAIPTGTMKIVLKVKPSSLSVQLDGKAVEAGTVEKPLPIDVGSHKLIFVSPGYDDFVWEGKIADGQEVEIVVAQQVTRSSSGESSGTPRWIPLTIGGVGLATLGVASVFAFQAKSSSDTEKGKNPLLREASDRDRISSLSTRANILFVTGGVLVVGAAILSFTTRWTSPDKTADAVAHFAPWASPSGAGVGAWGSF